MFRTSIEAEAAIDFFKSSADLLDAFEEKLV